MTLVIAAAHRPGRLLAPHRLDVHGCDRASGADRNRLLNGVGRSLAHGLLAEVELAQDEPTWWWWPQMIPAVSAAGRWPRPDDIGKIMAPLQCAAT